MGDADASRRPGACSEVAASAEPAPATAAGVVGSEKRFRSVIGGSPGGTRRCRVRVGGADEPVGEARPPLEQGSVTGDPYSTQPLRQITTPVRASTEIYPTSSTIVGHTGEAPTHGRDRPLAERPLPTGWFPGGPRRWIAADDPHPRAGSGCDGFAEPGESGFDRLPEPVAIVDAGGSDFHQPSKRANVSKAGAVGIAGPWIPAPDRVQGRLPDRGPGTWLRGDEAHAVRVQDAATRRWDPCLGSAVRRRRDIGSAVEQVPRRNRPTAAATGVVRRRDYRRR